MRYFTILAILMCASLLALTQSEKGESSLDAFEHSAEEMVKGLVEVGVGAYEFSGGSLIEGTAEVISGIEDIKESIEDFERGEQLMEKNE